MSKEKFWTLEKVLGFSALLVSLSTLIVFVYQTDLIRKQQYMSVYPHLDVTNFYTGSVNYQFVLQNKGVGPAFIKSIVVEVENDTVYTSIIEYVDDALDGNDSLDYRYSDIYPGQLISAKEDVILFGLASNTELMENNLAENTVLGANQLRRVLNNEKISIRIQYESIYGEVWEITNHDALPVKLGH